MQHSLHSLLSTFAKRMHNAVMSGMLQMWVAKEWSPRLFEMLVSSMYTGTLLSGFGLEFPCPQRLLLFLV